MHVLWQFSFHTIKQHLDGNRVPLLSPLLLPDSGVTANVQQARLMCNKPVGKKRQINSEKQKTEIYSMRTWEKYKRIQWCAKPLSISGTLTWGQSLKRKQKQRRTKQSSKESPLPTFVSAPRRDLLQGHKGDNLSPGDKFLFWMLPGLQPFPLSARGSWKILISWSPFFQESRRERGEHMYVVRMHSFLPDRWVTLLHLHSRSSVRMFRRHRWWP